MNTPKPARKGAKRRTHGAAFKRGLLELSQQPGASVAAIALEHGINANLLFKWRRLEAARRGPMPANSPVLLPVVLEGAAAGRTGAARGSAVGTIEVEFSGARLHLRGAVDEASLRCLLSALRQAP
jgi:transposase